MDPIKRSLELVKAASSVIAATCLGATTAIAMDSMNKGVGTVIMDLTKAESSLSSPRICYRNSILKRPLCH